MQREKRHLRFLQPGERTGAISYWLTPEDFTRLMPKKRQNQEFRHPGAIQSLPLVKYNLVWSFWYSLIKVRNCKERIEWTNKRFRLIDLLILSDWWEEFLCALIPLCTTASLRWQSPNIETDVIRRYSKSGHSVSDWRLTDPDQSHSPTPWRHYVHPSIPIHKSDVTHECFLCDYRFRPCY